MPLFTSFAQVEKEVEGLNLFLLKDNNLSLEDLLLNF